MKKIYSLVAVIAAVVAVNAQGTETFESANIPMNYADGNFTGETAGVMVNYQHSRDEASFSITGKGIMLRRNNEPSFVEFVIPNGVGSFTFQYRKAFTGASARQLEVFANGGSLGTTAEFGSGNGEQTDVYTHTVTIQQQGNVVVKITMPSTLSAGNRQVTIDNVSWTAYDPSLSTVDFSKSKLSLVKYTQVSDVIEFAKASEVKIYNMNGQVVKEAKVSVEEKLSVSDLASGMYIVTGIVSGEKVSQKILKK